MNIKQDYSFLFSSYNNSNSSNNLFYGINLADYASIKNGSYGKLMKSYYKEANSQTSSSGNKNDVTNNKNNTTDKTEVTVDSDKKQEITNLQKNVDELQSSVNKLLKKGSTSLFKSEYKEADKEALYQAVSDFVSDYNAMIESGKGSTLSSVAGMSGRMENLAGDYEAELKEIGITFEKGKMTIDKNSFKNADMNQVKKLFNDSDSLGDFVSKRTETMENAIANAARKNKIDIEAIKKETSSSVSGNSSTTNSTESAEVSAYKQEMTNMQKYGDELQGAANKLLETGETSLFKAEYTSEDKDALYQAVSDFVSDFNTVLEKGKASTVDSIVNMTGRLKDTADDYKEMLAGIGISVGEKTLTIEKDSFMNADTEQVKKLFNDKNSFGYFVSQRAESIEYAANNAANRNNLYTENGTYTNISAGTLYTGSV